jgi:hypothetical protein
MHAERLYRLAFAQVTRLTKRDERAARSSSRALGASPASIGVLLGLFGAGAIAGAVAAPPAQRLIPPNVILLGALWWWVAQMVALALAPTVFLLGAVYTVGALMGPIF